MTKIEKYFKLRNKLGLHARPAALFVQTATRFKSKINVILDNQEVDGKSIMGLLMLAAGYGKRIKVVAKGADAEAALEEIGELIERAHFYE